MNIETREVRDEANLTPAERSSGMWIPIDKKYVQKQPISDADYQRVMRAEATRLRKAAARLTAIRMQALEDSQRV